MRRTKVSPGLRAGQLTGSRPARKLSGGMHAHGCLQCAARYSDACAEPDINGRCQACRGVPGGRPRWETSGDPASCCRSRARPVTADEQIVYRLGGDTGWWLCPSCSRTIPYDPRGTGPGGTDDPARRP